MLLVTMTMLQQRHSNLAVCRLEEHEKDRLNVVTENDILKQKLKALCDQYEARDSHYNQQVRHNPMPAQPCGRTIKRPQNKTQHAPMQLASMYEYTSHQRRQIPVKRRRWRPVQSMLSLQKS